MASAGEEKKSCSKPTEQTSKGEFDIDDSQYTDHTNNLLDEFPEFSSSDEGTPVHTSNEYSDKVNIKEEKN